MKKLLGNIKEMVIFYKDYIIYLIKYPISIVLLVFGIILMIIGKVKRNSDYTPYLYIQIIGLAIIFIIFLIEINLKENYKSHLTRTLGISLAWFVSSIIFVDFKNEIDIFFLIFKLYTSWEYILIGCILYDFMNLLTKQPSEKEKLKEENEEKNKVENDKVEETEVKE